MREHTVEGGEVAGFLRVHVLHQLAEVRVRAEQGRGLVGVDQGGGELARLVDPERGVEEGFLRGGEGFAALGPVRVVLSVVGGRFGRRGSGDGGIVATRDLGGMAGEGREEEVEDRTLQMEDWFDCSGSKARPMHLRRYELARFARVNLGNRKI